jgi:hypothetical protein
LFQCPRGDTHYGEYIPVSAEQDIGAAAVLKDRCFLEGVAVPYPA